jgi:hypothetical protein
VTGTLFGAVAQVGDSATALQQAHVAPVDSVAVESPLPGGVAQVVRFMLNTVPSWVQIGGIILAAIVGVALVVLLIRKRQPIRGWLATRSRGVQMALAAAAVILLIAAGGMGAATWNYTQHSNDFCVGCHVMNPAFQKFGSDENKHAELSCHDCHQQPLSASVRQLYLWVAERPAEIREHAPVPNQICATCHITQDTATWQRIASTAGHRVHLESDSSALEDLQCVTCHGVEVHRFNPVSETCGTSGCHEASETGIVLGKMADQTVRHCTSCHEFTADVPALATRDSARGTLVPGMTQCLGCHEMQRVLEDFDARQDPHGGTCGMCHNPHEQETPAAAAATCATSGCHGDWREEPFHVGASHRRVGEQCITCHVPHSAKVDASDCAGCHLTVRERSRLRPPLPFDTTRALRDAGVTAAPIVPPVTHPPSERHVVGSGPAPDDIDWSAPGSDGAWVELGPGPPNVLHAGVRLARSPPAQADTFSHARHAKLACLVCHETAAGQGRLTFVPPRGCAICHHQTPRTSECASCHQTEEITPPQAATLMVTVPGAQPHPRPVEFLHGSHAELPCLECHTAPVTLAVAPPKAQCADCHTDHHTVERTCTTCHVVAEPEAAHQNLEVAHQRCDACHTAATVARLTPTRNFCATCHTAKATDHYEPRECTVCHFLAEPRAYQPKLTTLPPS